MNINETIAKELNLNLWQVENTVNLIGEGATIPFIARYRKEITGSLDDNALRDLSTRLAYLQNLEKRKAEVSGSIEEQGKLTPELQNAINSAATLAEVEDLYRPYKPKRKTRASVARERGLEPLAHVLLAQEKDMPDPLVLAAAYVDEEKGVPDVQAALDGAKDIIAEDISDNAEIRKKLRDYLSRDCTIQTRAAKNEDSVYSMYYDYQEPYAKIPGHRVLAINRGEREGMLKVNLVADKDACMGMIYDRFLKKGDSPARQTLVEAMDDGFARLLFPSLENELRGLLSDMAADSAINVFKANL